MGALSEFGEFGSVVIVSIKFPVAFELETGATAVVNAASTLLKTPEMLLWWLPNPTLGTLSNQPVMHGPESRWDMAFPDWPEGEAEADEVFWAMVVMLGD